MSVGLKNKFVYTLLLILFTFTFIFTNFNHLTYAANTDNNQKEQTNPSLNDITVKMEDGKLSTGIDNGDRDATANNALEKYKSVVMVFLGFCLITMIAVFIYNFTKLGTTSSNTRARQEVIMGLVVSGVATAGLGGVMIFFGFFYSLLG